MVVKKPNEKISTIFKNGKKTCQWMSLFPICMPLCSCKRRYNILLTSHELEHKCIYTNEVKKNGAELRKVL